MGVLGLSDETTNCVKTGRCPMCSQPIVTSAGNARGVSAWLHNLLECEPTWDERARIFWAVMEPLMDIGAIQNRGSSGNPAIGPLYRHTPNLRLKVSRRGKEIIRTLKEMILADVAMNREPGPHLTCHLCRQDWLVGEWIKQA